MQKTIQTSASNDELKMRLLYALILCTVVFYVVRLPLFIAGEYKNQMVPGYMMFTNNAFGVIYAGLWAWRGIRIKGVLIAGYGVITTIISSLMTVSYLSYQPLELGLLFKAGVFYFFVSTLTMMPIVTVAGCYLSDRIAPLIFKRWPIKSA